jgi:type IV secretory pathway TrbF-like protein
VTNNYLLALIAALVIALAVLGWEVWRNTQAIAQFRPIVVRINDLGNAQAVYLSDSTYRPQAPEVKHFLSDFVTKYYTHKKVRLEDYYLSKYYLSRQLGIQSWIDDQQTKWIKKLLNGQLEQTAAQVHKVSVTNLDKAPYEALVDFERIVYSPNGDQAVRHEDVTATIRFTFADKVEPRTIEYNPLGLTIIDFHADQAFH